MHVRVTAALFGAFAICTGCFGVGALALALDDPRPPCEGRSPDPAYASPGETPAVRVWAKGGAAQWQAPACLGWAPQQRFRLVVALAGEFRYEGDAESLLARFGAISAMRGLRYWSVTEKAWRVLISDASALEGAEISHRRPDFGPGEMKSGAILYFLQEDNRSSEPVVYRLRVLERAPARLVIETENVGPVRQLALTLFPPGALRATYFLDRQRAGTWGFYGVSATGESASALAGLIEATYVNRAAALYRHLIGVPPDRDPPLAP